MLSAWLIPFALLAIVGMMMLVSTIIAALGGWRGLARLYREPEGMRRRPARSFFMASIDLRGGSILPLPTNYSNCVSVDLAPDGLHLRVMLFRFSHPPLLIPWERIERYDAGRFLFWRTLTVHPRGTSTRIRLWGGAAHGVEEAARQIAAHSAQPARV